MPITMSDAPGVLPKPAKEIYVSAWNSAYDSTCKERSDRDECASKIAWGAVKKKYKKEGDTWVAKKSIPAITITNPATSSRAGTAAGSTSNLPHGGSSLFGGAGNVLGAGHCTCTKCGATSPGRAGVGCEKEKCSQCGSSMEEKNMRVGSLSKVKSLGNDRIGGHLVLWGAPSKRDLVEEYFIPETDFWLDKWGGKRPLLYRHGLDPGIQVGDKTIKLVGEDAVLGVMDTFTADEMGLWMEAQLDRRHKYKEFILELIESDEGMALSSGALPTRGFIVKEPDGCIKVWPIVEGSLELTPCEHRMANVILVKAAFNTIGENFEEEESMEDEKALWKKLGEKLGLIEVEEEEVVELEETQEVAQSEVKAKDEMEKEDDEEDSDEKDEEKEDEEKKSTPTEFILDETAIKAISTKVASVMSSAMQEALDAAIVPLQKEIKALKGLVDANKSMIKSAEEKAAEIIKNAPPIVKVRATEVKGTVDPDATEELNAPRPYAEYAAIFKDIVDRGMLGQGKTDSL